MASTPAQTLVVIAPVRDLALLLRDVAASVLVQLEGQGGHPGSDGGLPCYLDRATGATRGIPATTCHKLLASDLARKKWHATVAETEPEHSSALGVQSGQDGEARNR